MLSSAVLARQLHMQASGPYMCTPNFVKRGGKEKEKEEGKEEERKEKEGGSSYESQ